MIYTLIGYCRAKGTSLFSFLGHAFSLVGMVGAVGRTAIEDPDWGEYRNGIRKNRKAFSKGMAMQQGDLFGILSLSEGEPSC